MYTAKQTSKPKQTFNQENLEADLQSRGLSLQYANFLQFEPQDFFLHGLPYEIKKHIFAYLGADNQIRSG